MSRTERILDVIETMFPDAATELNFNDVYELTVAVILSAQTTDAAVNKVTVDLFKAYPDVYSLAVADVKDVEPYLKRIGLYRMKAKSIVGFANKVVDDFDGKIPGNLKDLTTLPGVGRKTANVVLSEYFKVPAIAVDTHVERVTKRLKIVRESYNVVQTEERLMRAIPKERWSQAHHSFILFGRYHCKAMNPDCGNCPLTDDCKYFTQHIKHKKGAQ